MNVLLVGINAKYIHSNPAVYSISSYVRKHLGENSELQLSIVEYTINQTKEEVLADLYQRKPDILAFSCYIWNWLYVQRIFKLFHKICPDTIIWLGGPEVSFTAEKILIRYPFLAGIMVGEGEETFTQICRHYENRKEAESLENIPGVVTKEGRGEEQKLTILDEIPFFYRDNQEMEVFQNRIVYYESSRGCPYRCSYCLSAIDKQMRFRGMDMVKRELDFFLEQKVPQVKFIDRTFNVDSERAKEIWQYLEKNDNGITNFHFEVAADRLTEEELLVLRRMRPGLVQLEIGVQSVNPSALLEIRRPMNTESLERVVKRLGEGENIHLHLDLIAGLPREGYESFKISFNKVYSWKPDQLQLGFLKVLKGSPLWYQAKDYGIVYDDQPPYEVLFTPWISYEELLKLKEIEEVLEIYYNSGQFAYTVAMLEKEFSTVFAFYEELAKFRKDIEKERGSGQFGHARGRRYECLWEFVQIHIKDKAEMYRALLGFDLYLREKMKTRPGFCPDWEPVRKESRCFYEWEEKNRGYLPGYGEYSSRQLAKMTHLERYVYSVWEKGNCQKLDESRLVLFDYKNKNPLTREAKVVLIRGEGRNG